MTRVRGLGVVVVLMLGLVLAPRPAAQAARAAADTLPQRLSDQEFWKLSLELSEPDGYFQSDNLLSNEIYYPSVMTELAQQGMTMIVVTHEMGFAKSVADLMVFMDQGEIVEQSPPAQFFTRPQSERTKLFLSQILRH